MQTTENIGRHRLPDNRDQLCSCSLLRKLDLKECVSRCMSVHVCSLAVSWLLQHHDSLAYYRCWKLVVQCSGTGVQRAA